MTPEESSSKADYIEFTLNVKAGRTQDWLQFGLDLNPKDRLISISDSFSSFEELRKIFDNILSELEIINKRTALYNDAVDVDTKALEVEIDGKSVSFNERYQQNFKPEFGKIDRVIHRHNSPGVSNVSYTRAYNGDLPPK